MATVKAYHSFHYTVKFMSLLHSELLKHQRPDKLSIIFEEVLYLSLKGKLCVKIKTLSSAPTQKTVTGRRQKLWQTRVVFTSHVQKMTAENGVKSHIQQREPLFPLLHKTLVHEAEWIMRGIMWRLALSQHFPDLTHTYWVLSSYRHTDVFSI